MVDALSLVLLVGVSLADEAAPEPATPAEPVPQAATDDDGWIDLGVRVDFGSAVESGMEAQAAEETLPPELEGLFASVAQLSEGEDRRAMRDGRWGFRPWLGWVGFSSKARSTGATLGGQLSHQWWTLVERPVRPAGETRLRAVGVLGDVGGWSVSLDATAGAWIGPVGLLAGPSLQADRVRADAGTLEPALGVGPTARLAARMGKLTPWVGLTPAWLIAGERPGIEAGPWDELGRHAGLVWDRRPIGIRVTGGWRTVSAGDLYEATVGLHLRPF